MSTRPLLVLGSSNRKKAIELGELFSPLGIDLQTLADYPHALDVVEDGSTFAENAALKAVQQAKHLDRWVLAEDSGLAVDALDGVPGIYSARYSGPGATDESNIELLLKELGSVALERRTAHYVCHMTLCDPSGEILAESEAYCRGRIVLKPRGSNGFGYDPVFEVIEYHRTFGELSATVKACLSHRARAAQRLIPRLTELVSSGQLT
jgi:XTP/dITP diphosphohydrolase